MADRLTQLQDCYDQLATQFYASIRYISFHHTSSLPTATQPNHQQNNNNIAATNHQILPSQSQDQPTQSTQPPTSQDQPDPSSLPPEQSPDSPTTFAAAQRELAHDLILKTKQIEYIISVLPGVENSKEEQERRIEELDVELREALKERERVEEERMRMLGMVEGVITSVRR